MPPDYVGRGVQKPDKTKQNKTNKQKQNMIERELYFPLDEMYKISQPCHTIF